MLEETDDIAELSDGCERPTPASVYLARSSIAT